MAVSYHGYCWFTMVDPGTHTNHRNDNGENCVGQRGSTMEIDGLPWLVITVMVSCA